MLSNIVKTGSEQIEQIEFFQLDIESEAKMFFPIIG